MAVQTMEDWKKMQHFRSAIAEAVLLLPEGMNETQQIAALNACIAGLHKADLPEYGKAINLLMGQKDRQTRKRDGFVFKATKRGRIRVAPAWKDVVVAVSRT